MFYYEYSSLMSEFFYKNNCIITASVDHLWWYEIAFDHLLCCDSPEALGHSSAECQSASSLSLLIKQARQNRNAADTEFTYLYAAALSVRQQNSALSCWLNFSGGACKWSFENTNKPTYSESKKIMVMITVYTAVTSYLLVTIFVVCCLLCKHWSWILSTVTCFVCSLCKKWLLLYGVPIS